MDGTKTENIKRRILIPTGSVLSILLIGFLVAFFQFQRNDINDNVESQTDRVQQLFSSLLERETRLLEAQLGFLTEDETLQKAFLEHNRDMLLRSATPIYDDMNDKFQVTHFYFTDADRVNFLRVHNPPRNGDVINRFTTTEAERTGELAGGIELGTLGQFTLRVVTPWKIDGELVGYIELGMEVEHLTQLLRDILNPELIFTIEKSFLVRENWENGLELLGREGDWDQFEDFVIIDQTLPFIPTGFEEATLVTTTEENSTQFSASLNDQNYQVGALLLLDVSGRAVGTIFVLNNVTESESSFFNTSIILTIFAILIGGALFGFFYVYVERIEVHQQNFVDELQRANADIEQRADSEQARKMLLERTVSAYLDFVNHVTGGDLAVRLQLDNSQQGQGEIDEELYRLGENLNQMVNNLSEMTANIEQSADEERSTRKVLQDSISEYMIFVQRVAQGDLTSRLNLSDNGLGRQQNQEIIQLGENLNSMVNGLADMASQAREVSLKIASTTSEILAATTQQLASATEQDTTINQTSTTTTEVLATVTQTAERAENVAQVAQRSLEVSQQGEQAVRDSIDGMLMIRHQVEGIAENILSLSEKTQQIGNIIASVNNLAEQSKVLALNASIEAARAGEEGKSFAVVAMEVRNLAEQSREATDQVREILNEIQQATNTAVMATEEGIKGVDTGQSLINRTGETIQELAAVIGEAAQAASRIAASTHQQTVGMDQLSAAMDNIRQASVQTTASVQQAERSAQGLSSMAQQMQDAVSRYQL